MPFNLDEAWLEEKLRSNKCELTGIKFYRGKSLPHPRAWSVDRVNSNRGYTKSNCRVVTYQMNVALNKFGEQAFADLAFAYVARVTAQRNNSALN